MYTINGCFAVDWPEMLCHRCGYRRDRVGCEAWRNEHNAEIVLKDENEEHKP